uniref:Cadherin domain-containing protein n=1 Tax=Gasterosteus aculeatus TaxID=69293 RepID=G3Q1C0_GASAC
LNATDSDEGTNSEIEYSLGKTMKKKVYDIFELDKSTGMITTLKSFDFETLKTFQFQVVATDSGTPSLSSNVTVHVFILDQNDNAPIILYPLSSNGSAEVIIQENVALETIVIKVEATDVDEGANGEVEYSFGGDINSKVLELFSLDKHTGEIRVKGQIDYEKADVYKLDVQASDRGHSPTTTDCSVIIKIQDVNDNEPEIEVTQISSLVPEDSKHGTVISLISVTDIDSGLNGKVKCSLIGNVPFEIFELDKSTGDIRVKGQVDYEENDVHKLDVEASDKGAPPLTGECRVIIKIKDVNDNPPTIEITSLSNTVSEDVKVGAVISLISVKDKDSGLNGVILSVISAQHSTLLEIRESGEDKIPFLVLQRSLDREQKINHSLILTAMDGGTPLKSANLNLTVTVLDINDNRPNFSKEVYSVILQENVALETIVIKVEATDVDEGANGEVEYSFGGDINSKVLELFSLDKHTGEIRVKGQIDYEKADVYKLDVQASDRGQPPTTTYCRVLIKIQDVNDNEPEIEVTQISSLVPEDSKHGTVISLISVTDIDSGLNGKVKCSLIGNVPFEVNSDNGHISALKSFDFETLKKFQFQVVATDSGTPSLSSNVTVHVFILDQNDNAPIILYPLSSNGSAEEIYENLPVGTTVAKVNALDADEGTNGEVEYSLSRTLAREVYDIFELDHLTGEENIYSVVTKRILDREEVSNYEIIITATDCGEPPLSTLKTLSVQISDVNDNRPTFLPKSIRVLPARKNTYQIEIYENLPVGTTVAKVNALDADEGTNGEVEYSLSRTLAREVYDIFELDHLTGEENIYSVVTKRILDREEVSNYEIIITATDCGEPPLSTLKTLSVQISDVNDNRPHFSQNPLEFYLRENNVAGASILSLSASDNDVNDNAVIGYQIAREKRLASGEERILTINSENGHISALKSFDFETLKTFQFQVVATDSGSPSLSSNVTVHVFILDQNDNAPIILYPLSSNGSAEGVEEIPRNVNAGHLVTKVRAYDADIGYNGWLLFSLQEVTDHSLFGLDRYTGQIRTLRSFTETEVRDKGEDDRETAGSHSLVLTALDGGKPPKSGEMNITVNVLDVNDNAPVFSKDVYSVVLNENAPMGTTVVQVNATDLDEGPNGDVVYSFSNSMNQNILNLFAINPSSGVLTVKGFIDYEEKDRYEIEIEASDKGLAPFKTDKSVIIKIVDINDNAPEIEVTSFSSSIPEDSRPGTTVALISVNDLDSGLNGKVVCSVNSNGSVEGVEEIPRNVNAGHLVTKTLDRETKKSHTLLLTALDGGKPCKSGTAEITVDVLDVNDNFPVFDQETYSLLLEENAPIGTTIIKVNASDLDEGSNGLIVYSLGKNVNSRIRDIFRADANTENMYAIVTKSPLDREEKHIYDMTIIAKDGGEPSFSSEKKINVVVSDVNDNRPQFTLSPYTLYITENNNPVAPVFKVSASDLDDSDNAQISYHIPRDSSRDPLFHVNPDDGVLYVSRNIDREAAGTESLVLTALDGGKPPKTGNMTIVVNVLDVNDNTPIFSKDVYSVTLSENAPIGTTVVQVNATDLDEGKNGEVYYSFGNSVSNELFTLFDINTATGEICVKGLIDYEKRDREKQSHYDLTITAKDAGQPALSFEKTISVRVSDVNDNSPKFSLSPYTFYVPEANEPGASLFSVSAFDRDETDNALISYHILRDGSENDKVTSFLNIDAQNGDILALKSFDFETLKTFQFQVVATDSGTPSLSSNVTVHVFILDQNDNAPIILYPLSSNGSAEGVEEIPRNVNAGHLVTKVRAYDADIGYNGWLLFSLQEVTDHSLFGLDRYTGHIRTLRSFTETDEAEHKLVILVKDNGNVSLSATATVNVLDVNDNAPVFTQDIYSVMLDENAPVGAIVLQLNATDLDEGQNGDVVYSFSNSVSRRLLRLFDINPSTGEIIVKVTKSLVNRETQSHYDLTIIAKDAGQPPLSSEKTISVVVRDVNDNIPEFSISPYTFYVREANEPETNYDGTLCHSIQYRSGEKRYIRFRVVSGSKDAFFEVNPDSGALLVLKNALDREQKTNHSLFLTAVDGGKPQRSGSLNISINVVDINDNPPIFSQDTYQIEIYENLPVGTTVAKVNALDADEGTNGEVEYSLSRTLAREVYDIFELDHLTGEILVVQKPLDRETAGSHSLVLTALDGGKPPKSGEMNITVIVLDVNDNAPVFSKDVYSVVLNENAPMGTTVVQLNATDLDEGPNGDVVYSFSNSMNQNILNLFDINPLSGVLTVKGFIDYEEKDRYEMEIEASAVDGGKPVKSGNIDIIVIVLDVNDNSPVFTNEIYSSTLKENSPAGTVVIRVNATDLDMGANSEILYQEVTDHSLFGLDRYTGQIRTL